MMNKNKYLTFWYHYNKPASQKANKPRITVHYKNCCHIVDNIVCKVNTMGHIRKTQPRFVIKGKCKKFKIIDGICYVD